MKNVQKRIIERFIGKTKDCEINLIKMSPIPHINKEDHPILERIIDEKAKARIIFDSEGLEETEKQLFKIILINNSIDESFVGRLEIYEI